MDCEQLNAPRELTAAELEIVAGGDVGQGIYTATPVGGVPGTGTLPIHGQALIADTKVPGPGPGIGLLTAGH